MDPKRDVVGRRRFLAAGAVGALAAVAGCTDGDGDGGSDSAADADAYEGDGAESGDDGDGAESGGGASDGGGGLDLREANVVDVAVEGRSGTYTFDVSLHHDDDGEDGYADWWQIERLDGTRLGRRDLLHAHSRQPFTRSETVDVPGGVDCVVVRGHDRTHGYGGLAAILRLDSGAYRTIEQGPEPGSFDAADCP